MNLHGWIIIGGWDPPNTSCIAGLHALAPLGASVVECSGDDTLAVHIKTLRRGWPYLRIIPGMYAYHSIAGHWDHPDYWERVRRALEVAADLCGSHVVLLDVETVFSRLPTQQITWRGATRALGQTERAWWIYPALIGNPLAESFIKAMYAAMGDRVRFVTPTYSLPQLHRRGRRAGRLAGRQRQSRGGVCGDAIGRSPRGRRQGLPDLLGCSGLVRGGGGRGDGPERGTVVILFLLLCLDVLLRLLVSLAGGPQFGL
jgi:hypothetical protein